MEIKIKGLHRIPTCFSTFPTDIFEIRNSRLLFKRKLLLIIIMIIM